MSGIKKSDRFLPKTKNFTCACAHAEQSSNKEQ